MTMAEGDLAVTELRFVRGATIAARPPPAAMTGALGWLRTNLLSSPFNIALTILIALLLAWVIPGLVKFLLIDAVWTGSDRDACREVVQHREIGACWPFVWERWSYFVYGSYPIPQRWRVDVFFTMLAIGVVWLLWLEAPRRDLGSVYFFVVLPITSFILLTGWSAIGLPPVDTALWGGILVTIVVASVGIVCSLPIGIMLALGRRSRMPAVRLFSVIFIEFVRGVPLVTVLFMASVMLPLFVPEEYSPDKLVRALIGIGGRARRLAGDPEGAIRRRHGGGPGLLADDAAHHSAAGAQDHHSEYRQHLYRPVQGYHAGFHRRNFRFSAHDRGRPHRSEMGGSGHQHNRLCGRGDLLFDLLLRHGALCPCDGSQARAGG
jgi:His/Glu/Gln/Arg/opine family amino acid ABC transporter permease subunit